MDWTAANRIDLDVDRRGDAAWLTAQWQDPHAQTLWVDGHGHVGWADGQVLVTPVGPRPEPYDQRHAYLLGHLDGVPVFARVRVPTAEQGREQCQMVSLRAVLDEVGDGLVGLAFEAAALAAWHASAGFCPVCGTPTQVADGGHTRWCPHCASELFPRTDPAVIVAVIDADGRLLLGRQPTWERHRMSVLAGFVEAGESAEQAVHREIREEVGVPLSDVAYVSSQPWPFPRSLMLAFSAHAADTQMTGGDGEIAEARWFTRGELTAAVRDGDLTLPGHHTVARHLVNGWLHGTLA